MNADQRQTHKFLEEVWAVRFYVKVRCRGDREKTEMEAGVEEQ